MGERHLSLWGGYFYQGKGVVQINFTTSIGLYFFLEEEGGGVIKVIDRSPYFKHLIEVFTLG